MRKSLKIALFVIALVFVAIFAISCGGNDDENYTSIQTPNLEYKDGAYMVTVSSDVKSIDISSLFTASENATFVIANNKNFDAPMGCDVALSEGNNTFYVKVTDVKKNEAVYTFVITRKKMCVVKFNTNGGSEIPDIQCDAGRIIEAPVSLKPGYSLKWDYDFNNPITESVIINAIWTANTYKITVDGTDTVVDVVYGQKPTITNPEKAGYKFTGWQYNEANFDVSKEYTVVGDITIKPVFVAQNYTINYITIGGTNNNPTTFTVEDEIVLSELIWNISDGDTVIHEFAGWYKDAEYTIPVSKIDKGTIGTIDLYAKWNIKDIPEEKIETTITFNAPGYDCDGTTQVVVSGDEYSLPKLEKDGYLFAGWKTDDDKISVQASGVWGVKQSTITLVPNWIKRNYSITYILNDGTNNDGNVDSYTITDTIELLAPTKQYSEFGGWFLDELYENSITTIEEGTFGDLILYAKWNEITYEVTFDTDGGEISQEKQTVVLGGKYTLVVPVKLGYKFEGWYDGENNIPVEGDWLKESNVTVIAKWSIETYTIEYNLDGGSVEGLVDNYTVITDDITLPIPTREGKIFLGWSVNNGPIAKEMIIVKGSAGNKTCTAHWCDDQAKNGFIYSISDGLATVVGYNGVVGANVVIPEEYNGCKVVAIGNNAFSGYGKKLESLASSSSFTTFFIPDTITRIGANAFTECADLKVQLTNGDDEKIEAWVEKLVIESGNEQVLDVIRGKRPAIGWRPYTKPKN